MNSVFLINESYKKGKRYLLLEKRKEACKFFTPIKKSNFFPGSKSQTKPKGRCFSTIFAPLNARYARQTHYFF
jgi:hypothetical protein